MQENFDQLRGTTLVTIAQANNLHVLITNPPEGEGKLVMTKGRCAGFIHEGIFYIVKEFSKGGAYNNAIIDTEIELVKTFFNCKQVISENDINEINEALQRVANYISKIEGAEDPETKQIVFNEAQAVVNASKIPNKAEVIEQLQNALEGKKAEAVNPVIAPVVSDSKMEHLLKKIAEETDIIMVQEWYDEACELRDTPPVSVEDVNTFDKIKAIHTDKINAYNAAKKAAKAIAPVSINEPVKSKAKPVSKPVVKAAAKKVAPVKKAAAKKSGRK